MKSKYERIRINGNLESSLRKKSFKITYSNLTNNNYLELTIKQKYIPKVLFSQIIFNLFLYLFAVYSEIVFFFFLILANFILLWLYCFVSILKNEFKDKSKKWLWTILILYIPVSAYFYPDFKRTQIL